MPELIQALNRNDQQEHRISTGVRELSQPAILYSIRHYTPDFPGHPFGKKRSFSFKKSDGPASAAGNKMADSALSRLSTSSSCAKQRREAPTESVVCCSQKSRWGSNKTGRTRERIYLTVTPLIYNGARVVENQWDVLDERPRCRKATKVAHVLFVRCTSRFGARENQRKSCLVRASLHQPIVDLSAAQKWIVSDRARPAPHSQ